MSTRLSQTRFERRCYSPDLKTEVIQAYNNMPEGQPNKPDAGKSDAGVDLFIQHLTSSQGNLKAYILASLGSIADVADVLQRTNLALWKNAASFRLDAPFMPWAVTIAKYEILSYCRDRSRDRHVFTEEVAALMLQSAREEIPEVGDRQVALRKCLRELTDKNRDLLNQRYFDKKSVAQISGSVKRSENAVKCAFVRIRKSLQQCIENRLKSEST